MKKFITAYKFAKQFKGYLYWNEKLQTWAMSETYIQNAYRFDV